MAISEDGAIALATARLEDGGVGDPVSNLGAAYVYDAS
jgi:hypothetical protein